MTRKQFIDKLMEAGTDDTPVTLLYPISGSYTCEEAPICLTHVRSHVGNKIVLEVG